MNKEKILVVDDEERMRKLLNDYLKKEGYEVIEAANGEEALDLFYRMKDISLILLDVMMPKINGYDVLKEIRETSDIPVIMLTAKAEEADELKGFSLGVDEYIGKPFRPKPLMARIAAILRRGTTSDSKKVIEADGIIIDMNAREVRINGDGIDLSMKEFELLVYFVKNQGIALSRDTILSNVWEYDYFGDARTIDTHVKKLRAKLGDKGDDIKTVWGIGYKFL